MFLNKKKYYIKTKKIICKKKKHTHTLEHKRNLQNANRYKKFY